MSDPLLRVSRELRAANSQLGALAREPAEASVYGPLAGSGPRAAAAPEDYAFAIEAIREGYLLHYGCPRVAVADDPDLALLAGDYLYALGLATIGGLGDVEAVAELADLISACAEIHASRPDAADAAEQLWRAAAERIGGI